MRQQFIDPIVRMSLQPLENVLGSVRPGRRSKREGGGHLDIVSNSTLAFTPAWQVGAYLPLVA
jgi:hypothetical protein